MPPRDASEGLRKPPKQSRSQDSTHRMLDAALAILGRNGMTGLSIAAVSRESGVSNGALYHRFGDRHGLLVAAQDRFLDQVESDWLTASAPLWELDDPDELLTRLAETFLTLFTKRRALFHAFMVTGRADPDLHARGARTNKRAVRGATRRLADHFNCTPEAADTAYRIVYAQAVLLVLFSEEETAALHVDPAERLDHLVRALRAILRPTPAAVADSPVAAEKAGAGPCGEEGL